ncbi:unnamed protein product, partial [Rotaria sp. Silwood2]
KTVDIPRYLNQPPVYQRYTGVSSSKCTTWVDLMSIINTSLTELSLIPELECLDQYFRQSNDKTQQIERILINRIHVYLRSCITDEHMSEKYLIDNYDYFQENIHNDKSNYGFSIIILIAWLKVYTEMYAFSLSKDNHSDIMEYIDKVLTTDESKFCLTLKIYIIKQLCQIYHIDLAELYEIFINRNCYWIRTTFHDMITNKDENLSKILLFQHLYLKLL